MSDLSKLNELINAMSEEIDLSDIVAAEQLAKISSAIIKCRVDKKMSQKEFAEFIGVSQGMVSKWESEDYNFTVEGLAKICEKLNLDLDITIKPKNRKVNTTIMEYCESWSYRFEKKSIKYENGVA